MEGFIFAYHLMSERSGTKSATLFRRLFLMAARGRGFVINLPVEKLINFWIFGQKQTQLGRTSSKTHKRAL